MCAESPSGTRLTSRTPLGGRWTTSGFPPPEIDRDAAVAVHCKGGYRSMIASSLLQRAGFKNVINLAGGFDAWQQAKLPSVTPKPVEA